MIMNSILKYTHVQRIDDEKYTINFNIRMLHMNSIRSFKYYCTLVFWRDVKHRNKKPWLYRILLNDNCGERNKDIYRHWMVVWKELSSRIRLSDCHKWPEVLGELLYSLRIVNLNSKYPRLKFHMMHSFRIVIDATHADDTGTLLRIARIHVQTTTLISLQHLSGQY